MDRGHTLLKLGANVVPRTYTVKRSKVKVTTSAYRDWQVHDSDTNFKLGEYVKLLKIAKQ